MNAAEFAPVVMVTPTVMDGQVVRWYVNESTAERGYEVVSASRNGVGIGGQMARLEQIDGLVELLAFARDISHELRQGKDQKHLATHDHKGLFGPLEQVK